MFDLSIFRATIGDRFSIKKWNPRKRPFTWQFRLFFRFSLVALPRAENKKICVKCCLGCDFEDFNLCDFEIPRTREKDAILHSSVVGVGHAKIVSVTAGACVAVIANNNVTIIIRITKAWTILGVTKDCPMLLFSLQRKSPRRDVVRILQREKKTLQTVIRLQMLTS
jgi:hypothetical protein